MARCPHCDGLSKALRAAETRNLEHARRETALENLIKEMFDHGEFSPEVLRRIQTSRIRLDGALA